MVQITLKQIDALLAVADHRSFGKAAAALNTTQPNISTRIASLEAQLDLTLMDRTAGRVQLTPAGKRLVAKARDIKRAAEAFVLAAHNDNLIQGTLRLGVTEMIAHSWLSSYLKALQDRFPKIDIDLTVDLSTTLSDALHRRDIDLALQNGPFTQSFSGTKELGSFPSIWVAAPALGLGTDKVNFAQMAQHPILTHAKGTLIHTQMTEHFAEFPDLKVRQVGSTNLGTCLQMAIDGLGIACLPRAMAVNALRDGRLIEIPYGWAPAPLMFVARFDAETAPHFVTTAAELAQQISRDCN